MIVGYIRTDSSVDKTAQVGVPFLPDGTHSSLILSDRTNGKRWGIAYEIPEYAMRAVLMYQDRLPLHLQGTESIYLPDGKTLISAPARIDAALPRSVQLDLQSGIKPGWLGTLSINWQQWGELQNLPVQSSIGDDGFATYFSNTWTFTGGVGHAITPDLSVGMSLSYMQPSSSPKNTRYGYPTSFYSANWTAGIGQKYQLTKNIAMTAGVYATRLQGAQYVDGGPSSDSSVGARYGTTWLYSAGGSLVMTF